MLHALDGSAVRRWGEVSVLALTANRAAIDRINVYPVADNDTGTNLLQTTRSALEAADRVRAAEPHVVLNALSEGALHGAAGNSGLLLSQLLRGMAQYAGTRCAGAQQRMTGRHFGGALERGCELAAGAVAEPAEGTMLTVLRAAARACREREELADAVHAATLAAVTALSATTAQRPELTSAGVVDAGGRGVVLILDALYAVVCDGRRLVPEVPEEAEAGSAPFPRHDSGYAYEVMYLLSAAPSSGARELRERLVGIGDCVSVADAGEDDREAAETTWVVHVHCDDVGAAIESGIEVGRVHGIRVTRFADQLDGGRREREELPQHGAESSVPARRAVLALAGGTELAELFHAEGAGVLTVDGTEPPGAREMLEAVLGTGCREVLLLPNDERLVEEADNAAAAAVRAGIDAVVIPTAAPVQGLAALAVHDPTRRTAEDTVALAEAAAATRRGELVVASEEALTWVGRCRGGDVLGMLDGEVVLIGSDRVKAARELVDRMLAAGGELVTALVPKHAPVALSESLAEHLRRTHPEVELACYSCGDSATELMLGVE
ncbi:DAK2 domain-containing protein [Actinopolyspora saharensis]|uniref:DhaL domain-containing protein n=1 Tax=Actinopolyspora saharensis TaxID=995062 RepID=A0A1H1D4C4_9ACTN|nr:DAK2 domain-containing protein [Actinopolyspora saharensis]SDQ71282.1 hypothetical protein SAMN04489718_1890 [Actinopolyspora saharensis]